MRVLFIPCGQKPEIREIDGSLKSMQELVGGLIQAVYPFDDPVALICNDEGKLLGLPFNRALRDSEGEICDIISGTFFLCGLGTSDFIGLSDELISKYTTYYSAPEVFLKDQDGHIAIISHSS